MTAVFVQFGLARDMIQHKPPTVSQTEGQRVQPVWKALEPAQVETLYFYDFESGTQGFESVDGTDIGLKWHTTDDVPTVEGGFYDGKAWWCGEIAYGYDGDDLLYGYGDWWFQTLETPIIDLREASSPTLTMVANWACEPSDPESADPPLDWDEWNVWVSTDGGATFDEFLIPVGGYNATWDTSRPTSSMVFMCLVVSPASTIRATVGSMSSLISVITSARRSFFGSIL